MNRNDAAAVVGWLMSTTTGWNDQSVEAYATAIQQWSDLPAAITAAKLVSETWSERSRPPLAVVRAAYDREKQRRDEVSMTSLPSAPPCDPIKGRQIAADAYVAECRRAGREPNWSLFNRLAPNPTTEGDQS